MKNSLHRAAAIFLSFVLSLVLSNSVKAQYRMSYEIGGGISHYANCDDKAEPGYTFFNEVRFYTGPRLDLGARIEDNFAWSHNSENKANFNDNSISLLAVVDYNFAFMGDFNPYAGVEFGGSMMHHQDLDNPHTVCYTDVTVGPRIGVEVIHHVKLAAEYRYNFFHDRFSYIGATLSWSFEM